MKRILGIALVLIAYLVAWPVSIAPTAWTPLPDPGMAGPFAVNDRLAAVRVAAGSTCLKCEDLAVDAEGNVIASSGDGRILRYSADFEAVVGLGPVLGRPLGLVADRHGTVYTADAELGLVQVTPDGRATVLTDRYEGRRFGFPDDLDLAPDSSILFTDASSRFGYGDDVLDIIEHGPNGRLFRYDLRTGATELVLDSLYFANGVAVSPDGAWVLVANMNRYQVLRHHLAGDRNGETDVFVDNLPGFPDGVNLAPDGTVWISIPALRNPLLDFLLPRPFLRKVFVRMPLVDTEPPLRAVILHYDAHGALLETLQDPDPTFGGITNVVPSGDSLLLGSIRSKGIGVFRTGR